MTEATVDIIQKCAALSLDIERRWHSTPVVGVLDMTVAAVPLGLEKVERSGTIPSF